MAKKKTAKRKTTKKKTAKKKRAGRKPIAPTTDQRIAVTSMRKGGMGLAEICRVLKLSKPTLKKYFRDELGPLVSGTRKFVPTDQDRKNVEALAGFGMSHNEIAKLILNPRTEEAICKQTLKDEFPRELNVGSTKANSKVAEALFKKATGQGTQSVTAAIWWTKCRMGWRGDALELTGAAGGPVEVVSTDAPKERLMAMVLQQREAQLAGSITGENGTSENGSRLPSDG